MFDVTVMVIFYRKAKCLTANWLDVLIGGLDSS